MAAAAGTPAAPGKPPATRRARGPAAPARRRGRPASGTGDRSPSPSTRTPIRAARAAELVRDVPDFPQPGVLFRDITPVLADAEAFADRGHRAGRARGRRPTWSSGSRRAGSCSAAAARAGRRHRRGAGAQGGQAAAGRGVAAPTSWSTAPPRWSCPPTPSRPGPGCSSSTTCSPPVAPPRPRASCWPRPAPRWWASACCWSWPRSADATGSARCRCTRCCRLARPGGHPAVRDARRADSPRFILVRWSARRLTDLQPAAPPAPVRRRTRRPRSRRARRPAGPSATRRVRARIARRMTPQRVAAVPPVLEPLASVHRTLHPKADLALLQHAYEVADGQARGPEAQVRRPLHHPPAGRRRRSSPSWAWTPPRWSRRCCTTPSRTPTTRWTGCARSSATRSRTSSTASPSSTRSSSATPPRPRRSARWSSRWPATRGCWSSSCPTGCTTCARCASCRRRSRRRRPARRWR